MKTHTHTHIHSHKKIGARSRSMRGEKRDAAATGTGRRYERGDVLLLEGAGRGGAEERMRGEERKHCA